MGYTAQFNLLSECYKKGEQPAGWHMGGVKVNPKKGTKAKKPTTKKVKKAKSSSKKQRGGSSCGASPSVSEMGVVDKPASLQATASELAWDNRMRGGANGNTVAVPPNENTSIKTNQVNNVSTYLNKLKDVVFDKNIKTGFAIVVERTTEHPSNSKQDKYKIKVIETKNNTPPSMTVLTDQLFSDILNTVKNKPFEVFPKKNKNTTAPITNNKIGAVNNIIPSTITLNNSVSQSEPQPQQVVATGGRKHKKNRK